MENCNEKQNECSTKSCAPKQCTSSGCEMTDKMMSLAEQAWSDLLKDKMKKLFETNNGERMDKIAQATVDAVNKKWKHKMQGMAACGEAKQNLKEAFMS
ncbi:hypothetical protein HN587_02530 [Candidatus Woesearchaeota archaeon]|jgi:hypothetical protein|nr:hypothetical protein [Candidatus Woesearchaeota archaeon]